MKKLLDKLLNQYRSNKYIYTFLIGLTIIAIITSVIYGSILSKEDAKIVKDSLEGFFSQIKNNELKYLDIFKNSVLSNILFIIVIWLLGISVIGIPIIIFMYFTKIFVIGFSITSIIINYNFKGIGVALAYIFPHHIINILTYALVIIYAITLSIKIVQAIIKKKTIDFKPIMNKYINVLWISSLVIIATCIIEVFIAPIFINFFI